MLVEIWRFVKQVYAGINKLTVTYRVLRNYLNPTVRFISIKTDLEV